MHSRLCPSNMPCTIVAYVDPKAFKVFFPTLPSQRMSVPSWVVVTIVNICMRFVG